MSINGAWPSIDPGELRHPVTFLDQVIAMDESGQSITWQPGNPPDTTWAKIDTIRGTDVVKMGQDVSQVMLKLTMRYRAGRKPSQRLQTSDGAQYVVQAVENVGRVNEYMVLTCMGIGENV